MTTDKVLEALKGLLKQVTKDCSISTDPKYMDLLDKCQDAYRAIAEAEQNQAPTGADK